MIVSDVMDEVAALLAEAGYRSFAWPVATVTPPAAIVGYPELIVYDETYGRGADVITLPVYVVFGRSSDRSTRDLYSSATAGNGVLKSTLEGAKHTSCDEMTVKQAVTDTTTIASVEYLVASLTIEVIGSGS